MAGGEWLRQRVRRALLGRAGAAAGARETLADARRRTAALGRRLDALDRQAARLDETRMSQHGPFSASMTVEQAWRRHPGAAKVFAVFHLPDCQGCAVRFDETLGEAAEAYDLDLSGLLGALNALL